MFEVLAVLSILGTAYLALTAAWSRQETWIRGAAVAAFAILVPLVMATPYFALSHARPIDKWSLPNGEHRVISTYMVQDEGIWVLLDIDTEPRLIRFPWTNEMANRLLGMTDVQNETGLGFFLNNRPEDDGASVPDGEFEQYIVPPNPPKHVPESLPTY